MKDQSNNAQNRMSGEINNRIYETYNNSSIPYGHHIYQTSSIMAMAKMCAYTPSQHALPHCKCVFCCCTIFPHIDLPSQ